MASIIGKDTFAYQDTTNSYEINLEEGNIDTATITNLSTDNITPINNQTTTLNGNLDIPSPFLLLGTSTNSNTSVNFTGSLSGNVTGTQNATVIAPNVITNSQINYINFVIMKCI